MNKNVVQWVELHVAYVVYVFVRTTVVDEPVTVVISEKGFGKKTKVTNFPSHKRGGVGIKAAVVTAKTGPIISVQTIAPTMAEAILVSKNGQTIRLGLDDIKLLGRTTQGVTIMRLSDGDAVSSIGLMEEPAKDEEAASEGKI